MRRFGDPKRFLDLLESVREIAPEAGVRSNFIVGFPGETEEEFAELVAFLEEARLDVIGIFGYSDEDGTEAASLPGSSTRRPSTPAWPRSPSWPRSSWPSGPRSGSAPRWTS